jgi:uncharacterized protein (UPF0276 family)
MQRVARTIPRRSGVGLKPAHVGEALEGPHEIAFFEVHAENYMGDGGLPLAQLEAVRERFAISLHGVGLSIGADRPLDRAHLARLRALVERFDPGLFSEHLAWSSHDTGYYNDLLPLPYSNATLDLVAAHIEEVQEAVGRPMLLENPSSYLTFADSTMTEVAFLRALAQRTGCGLLLDVNNVYVSATNLGFSATGYLDAFPLDLVGEIHLAGHATETDPEAGTLLIDSHDRAVAEAVWALYAHAIARAGRAIPTLIEWDNAVPPFAVLAAEAARANRAMAGALSTEPPKPGMLVPAEGEPAHADLAGRLAHAG